jgi:hypothetical protein
MSNLELLMAISAFISIACLLAALWVNDEGAPHDYGLSRYRAAQTPAPGLRRVLDAFRATRPEPLTMRTGPDQKVHGRWPDPLENPMRPPTSAAVGRPPGA